MRHALDFRSFPALDFLRGWPDQARAARLVLTRVAEIDGNLYYLLDPAEQLIEGKHPLAATLLRRAMIEDTLEILPLQTRSPTPPRVRVARVKYPGLWHFRDTRDLRQPSARQAWPKD
jgi:hypothetical protein